jgi:hypothetical protein
VQVGIRFAEKRRAESETKPQTRRSAIHVRQVLLHQTAYAVRCAEDDFRVEAFFVASLKTSLAWDSSS